METRCARCSAVTIVEDQKFCADCGWDLSKSMPVVPANDLPIPKKCPKCDSPIPFLKFGQYVCPNCGNYVGFNSARLHPDLVKIAQEWLGSNLEFCTNILGLNIRIARTLRGYSPVAVLGIYGDAALAIRGFGDLSYRTLEDARNKWLPEK